MAESLVPLEDFEARLPESLSEAERKRVGLLLQDASDLVREAVEPVKIPDPPSFVVRQLVMDLAGRVLNNPRGITTENIGDYSYSLSRTSVNGMALLPAELERLRRACGVPTMGAVRMSGGFDPFGVSRVTPVGWATHGDVHWWW